MITNQPEKTTIANSIPQEFYKFSTINSKKIKQPLLAKWLVDKNLTLYCQWVTKD